MASCIIDEKTALNQLKSYGKNTSWCNNNERKIREEYGGKYIAVYGGKCIDSDDDVDKLYEKLRNQNIDVRKVLVKYIPPSNLIWIL
ncbi:MAG: hypothetical protein KKH41_03990 [Candidatus Thermoplasmatota archaeon]|nr:hypothetical protein [Euryarchaeota archaeon]MBU4031338.1 hypothetical protein [Candidatus Thermoplasmatota archaeon]MBU4071390.1 hypothetical protein [Candidatus Thermoplasmatota archaeon]MBU4143494.1 hypothetical protein [Candidatus Thermoplasmatota archaeon]MBU4591728.1 hypothetical protein [Candidatus Thermoplasmatota archaeon]